MNEEYIFANDPYWLKNIYGELERWIERYSLKQGRVLEVGCGSGIMQDLVPNYIGVDAADYPRNYMHQPFCKTNAMSLPFPDNSFDGVWSIWVLEHIEYPEKMLDEMRRVVKPDGVLFFCAAYAVAPWISQGLHKRPFRNLSLQQRLVKLTIPLRASIPYKVMMTLPRRVLQLVVYLLQREPTRLRYHRLQPNYEVYWDFDADACVSLDAYNVALYFFSRGDIPSYPRGIVRSLLLRSQPQAYIVRKADRSRR